MYNLKEIIVESNTIDIGKIDKEFSYIDTGYKLVHLHAPYNRKVLYAHDSDLAGIFYDHTDLLFWFKEDMWAFS